jgi:hypothetical protein
MEICRGMLFKGKWISKVAHILLGIAYPTAALPPRGSQLDEWMGACGHAALSGFAIPFPIAHSTLGDVVFLAESGMP